jgi:recombinational DNA repair ATPase RecF
MVRVKVDCIEAVMSLNLKNSFRAFEDGSFIRFEAKALILNYRE